MEQILITGARGFLGKYFIDEIRRRYNVAAGENATDSPAPQAAEITTLGRSPFNDITVDLIHSTPQLGRFDTVIHLVGTCSTPNANNLNIATCEHLIEALKPNAPKRLIYISSTEVYGASEGDDIDESMPCSPTTLVGSSKLRAEERLQQWCADAGVTLTILRCPPIVGTGMGGTLRSLVNSIYRGTYNHIEGETAHLSVVHAVDVAAAALDLAPVGGTFNLTDGVNPSRHDLAEAFAYRLGNKRIFTLRIKRARLLARVGTLLPFIGFNKQRLESRFKSLTFSAERAFNTLGRRCNSVTEYLRTHNYDENSL